MAIENQDTEPVTESAAEEQAQAKLPSMEPIELWKCPECAHLNEFGDDGACNNRKTKCKMNIAYIEDLEKCFVTMTKGQYEDILSKESTQEPEKEKAPEPISENDWFCDCGQKNTWTQDPKSANCSRCYTKNETILYMI